MKKKVWFDVTSLYDWNGPAVGIIRTQQKLFQDLSHADGVELCPFIYRNGQFLTISLSELYKNKETKSPVSEGVKESGMHLIVPIVPKRQAVKLLAQSLLSLSPVCFRPIANEVAKISARAMKKIISLRDDQIAKDFVKKQSDKNEPALDLKVKREESNHPFKSGDVLILTGLSWEYEDIYERLFFLKKTLSINVISFCYDLIPIKYPQYCTYNTVSKFSSYFIELLEVSDKVCCISDCTQKDLIEFQKSVGAKEVKTEIIYLGSDILNDPIENKENLNYKNPYVIYVSTVERRKNHEILYKAYRRLIERGFKEQIPDLLFVGMKGWGVDDFLQDLRLDPLLDGKIKLLGRVSDEELDSLYRNALFVVFPSFYEGWGLGVSEALNYGKFVIASNGGSLPEVAKGFAEYLDPLDVNIWADRILFYSKNPKAINDKEQNILRNWRPNTWEQSSSKLLKIIESCD